MVYAFTGRHMYLTLLIFKIFSYLLPYLREVISDCSFLPNLDYMYLVITLKANTIWQNFPFAKNTYISLSQYNFFRGRVLIRMLKQVNKQWYVTGRMDG